MLAYVLLGWAYVAARWPHVANEAPALHISHTQIGRRPAVRRKPLNSLIPGAGHGPVSLPEAFGW